MSALGQVVFALDLPPVHPQLHNQGVGQGHHHSIIGARTWQDRVFTWTCSVAISPPSTTTIVVDPFGLKNMPPDLTMSLRCRPRAGMPASRQSLVDNHLCHYSRLLITWSPTPSPLNHHVQGSIPITLLDMPLRQAEVLLQGLQVELDSSLLPNDDRSQLHVVLSSNVNSSDGNGNDSINTLPHSIPTSSRPVERKRKIWQRKETKRTLDSSFIPREVHQRLTNVLESEVGADIQIMFAKDPFELIWMDSIPTDDEIHAHSCILKTVNTESMRRLLNTFPPEEDRAVTRTDADRAKGGVEGVRELLPRGREGNGGDGSSGGGLDGQSPKVGSHGQATAGTGSSNNSSNSSNSSNNDNKDNHKSRRETRNSDSDGNTYSGSNGTQVHSVREPIRAIRFEDSPPAAVRAVVRYVYLGERPVVEANCGYTVKDLMALATFLGIEPLENYCVALVLGLPQNCCCSESYEHRPMMCSRHSPSADWQQGPRAGVGTRARARTESRLGSTENMMMPPESMLQTLFAWGHRFPRIEQALIEVLVSDHGKILSKTEENVLSRYKDHQAFKRILIEMMSEQVRQRSEDGHAPQ